MNEHHDLDDGATEEVAYEPLRKLPTEASVAEVTAMRIGGHMARMRAAAARSNQEFTMIRSPLGVIKVALPHLIIFGDLWRLWASKRVTGGDSGVTVNEVAAASGKALGSVRTVLATLIRNGLVRSTQSQKGWQAHRAHYYPTELGVQALAISQMLGPGTSIQVGKSASAWKSRSATEPVNIFRHAQFLRGNA